MRNSPARAIFVACWAIIPTVAAAGTFNVVGTHPDAILQSTSTGKTLSALAAFNGKIYAGFGDYNSNTGPIGIRSFNPTTDTFSALLRSDPTEAIYQFRQISGKLYAPDIDPKAGESSGGYAVGTVSGANETWQHKAPVTAIHMYDVSGYGGNLWMAGAQGNNATVWQSTDGGTTWNLSLNVLPSGSYSYVRVYGMGECNGKLYASVDAEATAKSHVFDGTSWSDGPSLLPNGGMMSNASAFAGRLIYQSYECGLGSSKMYTFDGTSASYLSTAAGNAADYFYDYKIVGNTLYALDAEYVPSGGGSGMTFKDMVVKSTTDLTNWQTIAVAPTTTRSLAILNNQLFLGATNAQIYQYSDSIPEPATLALLLSGAGLLLRRRLAE